MSLIIRDNIKERFLKKKKDWLEEKRKQGIPVIFLSGNTVNEVIGDQVAVVDIDYIYDSENSEEELYDECIYES